MPDYQPTYFHTACWIDGRLVAHYTHETELEALKALDFYRRRPEWHSYTRITSTGPQFACEWVR